MLDKNKVKARNEKKRKAAEAEKTKKRQEEERKKQEEKNKEIAEISKKYIGRRIVSKEDYDYLIYLSKNPDLRSEYKDYNIKLINTLEGKYLIEESLGNPKAKASKEWFEEKYLANNEQYYYYTTPQPTISDFRRDINAGRGISSGGLFIKGYGLTKEYAEMNKEEKVGMVIEGTAQGAGGVIRAGAGASAVGIGLGTCVETAGGGCLAAGAGAANVSFGGNEAFMGGQKILQGFTNQGYTIKGTPGEEYAKLKAGKEANVNRSFKGIINPIKSTMTTIGFGEDDYDVLNMMTGQGMQYASQYVQTYRPMYEAKKAAVVANSKNQETGSGGSQGKREINKELHEKINSRGKEHFANLQAEKQVEKSTLKYNNFDHISKGEVQVKGDKVKVTGGHSTQNGIVVEEKLQEFPGGSYEAKIKIPNPNNPNEYLSKSNNGGKSTMFPDHWTENRIKVEIDSILKNPNNKVGDNVWVGRSSTGVVIRVIYREGKVITAYPIDPKQIVK